MSEDLRLLQGIKQLAGTIDGVNHQRFPHAVAQAPRCSCLLRAALLQQTLDVLQPICDV